MEKEKSTKQKILSAGAASAVCGATLYAVGKFLSFLFRDVDPKRAKKDDDEQDYFQSDD